LEVIKPPYQAPIDATTYNKTIEYFEKLMKILHPFMPFITEEIFHILKEQNTDIIISDMPVSENYDEAVLKNFDFAQEVVVGIRNIRNKKNIPNKEKLELSVKINKEDKLSTEFNAVISKLSNLASLTYVTNDVEGANRFMVKSAEFYIPMSENIDVEAELAKLKEDLKYNEGFLIAVNKKLSNERFVNNAPAKVVDMERKKAADAEQKIIIIKEQISKLS
jgi:valyl-tRNA synthetase